MSDHRSQIALGSIRNQSRLTAALFAMMAMAPSMNGLIGRRGRLIRERTAIDLGRLADCKSVEIPRTKLQVNRPLGHKRRVRQRTAARGTRSEW